MSIIRSTQYPNRWNPPSADAPQGSGKNRTSPTSNDGSYFDEVWFNDMDSLNQALFIASGISPDGTQDVGSASQIFDALINNRWSAIGNYSVGTIVTASNGKQYYCNQVNGRDTTVSDPETDLLDVWREYPYRTEISGNNTSRLYFDGRLEIELEGNAGPSGSPVETPLPTPALDNFDSSNLTVQLTHYGLSSTDISLNVDLTFGQKASIFATTSNAGIVGYKALILTRWA